MPQVTWPSYTARRAAARRTAARRGISEFLLTFPFEPKGEPLIRKGAKLVGME